MRFIHNALRPARVCVLLLLAACAPAPQGPLPEGAPAAEALLLATRYYHAGRYAGADSILARYTLSPGRTEGVAEAMNARVLQLRAQVAARRPELSSHLMLAETYAAWALYDGKGALEPWLTYTEIRRRREGYQSFLRGILAREPVRYPGTAVGERGLVAAVPREGSSGTWTLLQALLSATDGKIHEARLLMEGLRSERDRCLDAHVRALLLLGDGDTRAAGRELETLAESVSCTESRLSPTFHRMRAHVAAREERYADARAALLEAVRLDPGDLAAAGELAVLERRGRLLPGDAADLSDMVRANPYSWASWSYLWQREGRVSTEGGRAFQALADEVRAGAPYALPPHLAAALVRIRQGDFAGAGAVLASVSGRKEGWSEFQEARLVVTLASGSQREVEAAFGDFQRASPEAAARIGIAGWSELVVASARPAEDVERQRLVALWLDRASREMPDLIFLQAGARAFLGTVLPRTPEGSAAVMEALVTRTDYQGVRILDVEEQLRLTRDDVRVLTERSREFLMRIGVLERESARLSRELVLTRGQVQRIESEVGRLRGELARAESRLVRLIDQRDARVLARMDEIAGQVRAHADELRQMGIRVDALAQGRSANSRSWVRELIGALSAGPTIKGVKINLITVVTTLLSFALA